jgi:hypothetical protein
MERSEPSLEGEGGPGNEAHGCCAGSVHPDPGGVDTHAPRPVRAIVHMPRLRESRPMATTGTRPALSDEALTEMLSLIEGADSVELKLTVPESSQRSAIQALGLDPLEAQIRQVFFFDTPDLALSKRGVVVRARRVQRKGDDSVVKLRPVVPDELAAKLRSSPMLTVEVDAMPGGYVCSASLKGVVKEGGVKAAIAGDRPLRKLFSKEQRAFYAEHAPAETAIDDLAILGPIFVLKLKSAPGERGRRLVTEMWLYPDGSRDVGGLPGRRRIARPPRRARHRPLRRAADEDPQGAGLLLQAAARRRVSVMAHAAPRARAGRRP